VDFSKHLQKAEEALRRRNWDFAVEVYQQLIEIDPDLPEARAGLRQALRKRAESKGGGGSVLGKALGAGPLAMAKTLAKAGRHDAAAKQLEAYLSHNPLDVDANLRLGGELEAAGHRRSARAVYEFVAEIAPKNPEGLKRAGAMLHAAGEHTKALEYYERALAADPRDQDALKARKNLSAEAALSKTQLQPVRHSRDLIKDKEQASALERERRMHLSDDDLRQALEQLERRFAEAPNDPELMLELAGVHERLKDFEAAGELVERALQYRKDSFDLLCRSGDLRSKVLKKALAKADKAGDMEQASRIEAELSDHEARDYRRRVEMHPGDAALRLQLAKRLIRKDELDSALGELQKANTDSRVQRDALLLMGQCFQRKGFVDLARKNYLKALEGLPDGEDRAKEILYNLGAIAEAAADVNEARNYYARLFEVDIAYRDVAAKMEKFR
jgi:tetratricopeptide (TPR) repeat protein